MVEKEYMQIDNTKEYYRKIIGTKVKGIIDRPMGTYHPIYKDLKYLVNYGHVDNILANDGEEQDVYFLGVDKPLDSFCGIVVAVFRRVDDVEDKWIVLPEKVEMTRESILSQINFQEQYFEGELIML